MTAVGQNRAQIFRSRPEAATQDSPAKGKLPLAALLYLLMVLLPIGFELGPLYLTSLRLLLLVLFVPLMLQLLLGRFGRLLWPDVLFFMHIAWTTVALGVNNPSMVIGNIGAAAIEFLGGYLVARATIRSKADFIMLARWLGFLVCLTLPLALIESQTGNAPILSFLERIPGLRTTKNFYMEPRMGLQRAQVFLAHPIHYGLFCSSAFSLVVLALRDIIPNWQRLLMAGAVALCVFLSLSSGAMLPLMVQMFLLVWIWVFHRLRRPWLPLVVLIMAAYIIVDLLSNRTPTMVFLSYATFSAHTAYWRAQIFEWGMINVWDNPIFGLGFNDWVRPYYMYSGSMDNFWLVMAVRYGIPGFLLVALGFGIGLVRVMCRDFSGDPALIQMRRAWIFTFIGLTLTLCTVHIWTTIYSFIFFLFGAGMWLINAEPATALPQTAGKPDPVAAPGLPLGAPRYTRFPVHKGTAIRQGSRTL